MRQAVDQTDDWMHYRVELDGQPLDYVIEADDEAGYVIIHDPDAIGRGTVEERRVEGRVTLIDTRGTNVPADRDLRAVRTGEGEGKSLEGLDSP